MVEKPKAEATPSRYAAAGRPLDRAHLQMLRRMTGVQTVVQLTDAIAADCRGAENQASSSGVPDTTWKSRRVPQAAVDFALDRDDYGRTCGDGW